MGTANTFTHLLAKSCEDAENPLFPATLEGHTLAVLESFRTMFGTLDVPSRLAGQWLDFFDLQAEVLPAFEMNTLFACLLHDLGKANSGFQTMIRRKGRQLVRHEHLTAVLLQCPEIRQWITATDDADIDIITSAVLGHHLKAEPQNKNFAAYQPGVDQSRFSLDGEALTALLHSLAGRVTELPAPPPAFSFPEHWDFFRDNPGSVLREQAEKGLKKFHRTLGRDEVRLRLLIAVRAALIVADSAGSGLPRVDEDITSWLDNAFHPDDLLTDRSIREKILVPRQKVIEQNTGKPFQWQDFQKAAGDLPDRAVLISSCGSGKTLAAWKWIEKRLEKRAKARAIFLYPTKATAGEGFRDYVSWAPEGMLLHSSNSFDLHGMFDSNDPRSGDDFLVEERLYALAYWNRRIFSATVHQFLGFLQHSYRSICLLPLLADSVVVVDEVHSFDKALFSALKQLLEMFNLPVLCMTATLPKQRQRELAELGLTIFPQDTKAFENLHEKSSAPRYRVHSLGEYREDAEATVTAALDQGKKVLWVVNTIDRCQEIARRFEYAKAICYHSRFKLEDRKERHKTLISAFQEQPGPLLAVTTQVCEMSLDLDADILVSEAAPITSMIQRMGRCNRRLENPDLGAVYFYEPEDNLPYSDEDLLGVKDFLAALDGQTVSQERLEELLDEFGDSSRETERYTAFLKDRAWAQAREKELADIKETCYQAILAEDNSRYWQLRNAGDPWDGLILPVPKYPEGLTWENERIGSFPRVASESYYDKKYGFSRQPGELII
ncbi:MAG: CRISPR-associated helicase Cas3' [Candidatus Electrothrix sp. GW3-4]|uniref:CRISPR-associated helicase Cas3' n=1 Tax=Candidatus Electrothrix sp. GW3-4 TaxID=3126740 RepID=UPI0030D26D8D